MPTGVTRYSRPGPSLVPYVSVDASSIAISCSACEVLELQGLEQTNENARVTHEGIPLNQVEREAKCCRRFLNGGVKRVVAEVPRLVLRQEGEALHDWVVDVGDHERRGHDRHIVRDDRVNHVVDSIEEPEDRLSISIHAIRNLLDHPFRFLANLHCDTNLSREKVLAG